MEAGSAAATLVRGEPADRERDLTVHIEYVRSEPGDEGLVADRHDPGDDAGRPALSGRLGADHGAAMAGYASISSLLVIPAAVLMGIAAFLLWVTGVVLWVAGRRRPSPRPPSIPPAQRVVHGTDGRIGPGAWKE